jgi:hypothetical protein
MKKIYILMMSVLFFNLAAKGQFVEIGTGTEKVNLPAYTFWNYSYASMIYLSDEVGAKKTITKIAFNNNIEDLDQWGAGFELTKQKLWIKHTDEASFGDVNTQYVYENPEKESNGYTLVFDGSYYYGPLGWVVITLDTPFEYNGTDNIILHWENSYGTEKSSMKFAGTKMGDGGCMVKCWGDQYTVPKSAGYMYSDNARVNARFYYSDGGLQTPEVKYPISDEIKVDLYPELDLTFGAKTTRFDILLGESVDDLKVVESDVALAAHTGAVNIKHNLTARLKSETKYFMIIKAKDDADAFRDSPMLKFTTEELINVFPWQCGFEDYHSNNDPENPLDFSSTIHPDKKKSQWKYTHGWNAFKSPKNVYQGDWVANCNYHQKGEYTLRTPRIHNTGTKALKFWWKNGFNKGEESRGSRAFNTAYVEISTDGGETWNELKELTPVTSMSEFKFVNVSIASYIGDDVYIRWRVIEDKDYEMNNFWLDNIEISDDSNIGVVDFSIDEFVFPDTYVGADVSLNIPVTNIGTAELVINGGDIAAPFSCVQDLTIAPSETGILTVKFTPTASGDFSETLTLKAGDATGETEMPVKGKALDVLETFFETFDLSNKLPSGWNALQSSKINTFVQNIWIEQSTSDVFSPPHSLKMNRINSEDLTDPVILCSPGVSDFGNNTLTFYAKKKAPEYTLTLIVGVMSDPNDANTFTAVETIDLTPDFEKYTIKFKPNTKGPHIAFKYGEFTPAEPFPFATLRIDNIGWETGDPGKHCPKIAGPVSGAKDVDSFRPIELQWTASSGGVTGYKITVGTNEDGDNIENALQLGADKYKYTITGDIPFKQQYAWSVVAVYENGESENCPVNTFTTMDDPTVTEYPYVQTFDDTDNIERRDDVPLGMSMFDGNGNGINWDMVTTPPAKPGLTHNNSRGALVNNDFGTSGKDDWFFSPPLQLEASAEYNYEFFIYTLFDIATGKVYHEEMDIWIGKGRTATDMTTKLEYADVNDHKEWKRYTKDFTVDKDGIYYIGFHAKSAPQQYVLLFDDLTISKKSVTPTDNAPKWTKVISPIEVSQNEDPVVIDLSQYATDSDNDPITFAVESNSNTDLVNTAIDNNNLTISFAKDKSGKSDIVLKATANGKSAVTSPISVTVKSAATSVFDADKAGISVYPNPTSGSVNIDVEDNVVYDINIFGVDGNSVYRDSNVTGKLTVDVTNWNTGVYFVKIDKNRQSYTIKLLVK